MPDKISPTASVVPILALDENGAVKHFLGTGAFCGDRPYLATANHVIGRWTGRVAVGVLEGTVSLHDARVVSRSPESDLAILRVSGYSPPFSFPLAEPGEIVFNQLVFSFEYGTTRVAGKHIHFAPATRMGNVTRTVDLTDQYGVAGKDMLELSFPALRGASGSPIINANKGFSLWGIVVANVSYHLLPAQIESVVGPSGQAKEEIKYMLPQAVAVHVRHLRQLMEGQQEQ